MFVMNLSKTNGFIKGCKTSLKMRRFLFLHVSNILCPKTARYRCVFPGQFLRKTPTM